MSLEGDGGAASQVSREYRNEAAAAVKPLSSQPRVHLREKSVSGSSPTCESGWGLGDEPPSRTRSSSLPSWEAHQDEKRSSLERTLSDWVSGFGDDSSAYLHPDNCGLEQDTRQFRFDQDTDAGGNKPEAEEKRQRNEAAENCKSHVYAPKLQGDRAGENAHLETANGITPLSRPRTSKSISSQSRKDPNMVSTSPGQRELVSKPLVCFRTAKESRCSQASAIH